MQLYNLRNKQLASQYVAIEFLKQIKARPDAVLGLATGSTMTDLYTQLSDLLNANHVDVSGVRTFNLDEYVGAGPKDLHSYYAYMHQRFFNQNEQWNEDNIYIPSGVAEDLDQEAKHYEDTLKAVGQPDIQILGIGENGHIGFNEPGTPFDSQTRVVDLTPSTMHANSVHFKHSEDVPKQALSMGLSSIMRAKRIILLAFGDKKIDAIQRLVNGETTEDLPASILHNHDNIEIIVDDVIYQAIK
ncbi:glucosamine-6-phosphate deaminase [Staphylococcus simulans]|uniref:glucosamine-6-phosphate deaminase n=1 Tax=Staphylococcus simulans TaxID=1286 RepID=UPI000D1E016E|nr:glucosamine-6-phosphate deaminase [Staphylococcus simulans]PTI87320.1 glucosamine-6-phosphate deaminase [Staphylococcus simulans]RIN52747.1 glucosamine-6-phosphate deaminase [Staphylococcus simulans]UXR52629.1 glucosamine-6-phosphate deaminase [Staphylococcus simulans]